MSELTPEERWRVRVSQKEANERALALLAKEVRLEVPKSRNGNGTGGGSWHDLPPVEAYEDEAPTAPRETAAEVQEPERDPLPAPIAWADLRGMQPPARIWWVQDWLTPGATLLAGPGAAGKSLVCQGMLTALALGQPYVGHIGAPRSSLLWACEDDREELWRRQLALCEYFQTDLGQLDRLHIVPRVGHDNTLVTTHFGAAQVTPLLKQLGEQVNDLGVDILALDNVRQMFAGNENSGHDPTLFVNALLGLVRDRPFAVLLLHHTSKSKDSEFAGNMAWENAVRSRWYLGPKLPDQRDLGTDEEPDPALRYLARRKSNYAANDFVKLLWREGVFRPEAQPEGSTAAGYAKQAEWAEQAVLHAVREAFKANIRVTRAPNSPASLVRFMRQAQFGVGIPDKLLRAAITQLLMRKQIVDAEIGYDRKNRPVAGLVPAGNLDEFKAPD